MSQELRYDFDYMNQMKDFERDSQAFRVPILSNFVNPNRKKGSKSSKSGASRWGLMGSGDLNAIFCSGRGKGIVEPTGGWLWKPFKGTLGVSQYAINSCRIHLHVAP